MSSKGQGLVWKAGEMQQAFDVIMNRKFRKVTKGQGPMWKARREMGAGTVPYHNNLYSHRKLNVSIFRKGQG